MLVFTSGLVSSCSLYGPAWFGTGTAFSRHRRVSSSVANVGSAASPSSLLPNNSHIRLHVQKINKLKKKKLKSVYIYVLTKQRRRDDIPVRRYQHPGQQQDARRKGGCCSPSGGRVHNITPSPTQETGASFIKYCDLDNTNTVCILKLLSLYLFICPWKIREGHKTIIFLHGI